MQYLGNFKWEKENGKIARVDEKAFVGFSGKVVKTIPSYARDLIMAIVDQGNTKELEILFNEIAPFCDLSYSSSLVKLYDQIQRFSECCDSIKDTPKERILKVIMNNEKLSYFDTIINYSNFVDKLFGLGLDEKEIISTLNHLLRHGMTELEHMDERDLFYAYCWFELSKYLPNNGKGIPRDQRVYALDLIQYLYNNTIRFDRDNPLAVVKYSFPAFATWLRSGQIKNAILLRRQELNFTQLFYQLCILSYQLGYKEVKATGNLMNKLAELVVEWEDKHDQIFREYAASLTSELCFEDDTYIVRIPRGEADFIREGRENNNCVGTFNYYELMLRKQIFIVFIREKVNPDKAFITCEISPRGKILQYLGRSNVEIPAADTFKKKYQAFLKENFNH